MARFTGTAGPGCTAASSVMPARFFVHVLLVLAAIMVLASLVH